MQSKEEQLTSERVEARPMGISWAQLEHQDKVEGDEEVAHSCTRFPCYLGMEI